MPSEKNKGGRPSLPEDKVKKLLGFRAADTERMTYESAAKQAGLSLSEWLRQAAQKAVKRQTK
jgi:hypothetical protein